MQDKAYYLTRFGRTYYKEDSRNQSLVITKWFERGTIWSVNLRSFHTQRKTTICSKWDKHHDSHRGLFIACPDQWNTLDWSRYSQQDKVSTAPFTRLRIMCVSFKIILNYLLKSVAHVPVRPGSSVGTTHAVLMHRYGNPKFEDISLSDQLHIHQNLPNSFPKLNQSDVLMFAPHSVMGIIPYKIC